MLCVLTGNADTGTTMLCVLGGNADTGKTTLFPYS